MIHWMNAAKEKPSINRDDKFDKEHKISKRVLVYYKGALTNGYNVGFARFYRELEDWVIEGFRGHATVQYYSEINDPNDGDESLAYIILNKDHDQ